MIAINKKDDITQVELYRY